MALRSFMQPTLLLCWILLVPSAGSVLLAQDKSFPSTDASVSRSGQGEKQPDGSSSLAEMTRRSIIVDVIATDPQGRPVSGLKEEDFRVFEKVDWVTPISEKITRFQAADNTARRGAETRERFSTPLATQKESTGAAERGDPLTVLLLDDLNTDLFAPSVKEQVAGMADQGCDEHSRDPICVNLPIAVLLLGPKLEMLQDFSTDRSALRATLHRLFSQTPGLRDPVTAQQEIDGTASDAASLAPIRSWDRERRGGTVDDRRTQLTVDAIRAIARRLEGYSGRKKLIWVSSSFPFSIDPDPGPTFSMIP